MGFSVESHLVKEGRIGYFSHVLLNSRQSRGIIRQSFKSKNLTATHKHVIDQEQGFAWIKILNPIKQQGETNVIKKRHWVQTLFIYSAALGLYFFRLHIIFSTHSFTGCQKRKIK